MRNGKGQFTKGLIPWNKGIKGINNGHENYNIEKKGCFKKGHKGYKFWSGKHLSREHIISLINSHKGKPSPRKGKTNTLEHRMKLSISHTGKKLSEETRNKMSKAHEGEKCHFWKGGISKLCIYKHYRNSEYKKWREKVFKRNKYTCQKCGEKGCFIHPHHLKSYTFFPKLRYVTDNGTTLCVPCHRLTHFGH